MQQSGQSGSKWEPVLGTECVPAPSPYVEAVAPRVMAFEGAAFGVFRFGHEGGAPATRFVPL